MQAREKVEKSRFAVFSNDLRLRRGEKLQAVVARSAFQSQNLQTTPPSDHFWKLGCRKSARRCGVKQILKSKWTNHLRIGPLLGIELRSKMLKKYTPLWREAHFQVKTFRTPHARTTFEGSDAVFRGKRKGFCTLPKVRKT